MRTAVRKLPVLVCLSLILCFSSIRIMADAPPAGDPLVAMLEQDVADMQKGLGVYAKSLAPDQQAKLQALLQKQQQQLDAVKAARAKITVASGTGVGNGKDQNKDLAGFFETGSEIRKLLGIAKPVNGGFKAADYSPDPSYCANHCYEDCGYNSLGEMVCWHTCYRCCSNGGC